MKSIAYLFSGQEILNKSLTFNLYCDPGHGWLKVPRKTIEKYVPEILSEISKYSYMKGNDVFLEEDCDLGLFIRAANTKGICIKYRPFHNQSKYSRIRNYKNFEKDLEN